MEKTNLLLVEDDVHLQKLLRLYLRKNNDAFEIFTAGNGYEALEILKKTFIPIVVTDLMMPEMNGFRMIEEAKKSPEIIRRENIEQIFIVISSMSRQEDIHKAISLGAYDVLPKPLDESLFLAKIHNYYKLYQLMLESEARYQKAMKLNEEILEGHENRQLENRALTETIQRQKEIYRDQLNIIQRIQSLGMAPECKNCKAILAECEAFLKLENLGK